MAGIGFELKKLFSKKGILANLRAYGYAGIVTAGPMLLGFAMILGVMYIADWGGATTHQRELLVSFTTYDLLSSLTVTSFFSLITTRYVTDMLYTKQNQRIMPSFYGSLIIMLGFTAVAETLFLIFCGVAVQYRVLLFLHTMIMIVVWAETNYLTAIKDYKNMIITFAAALVVAFVVAVVLVKFTNIDKVISVMAALSTGYGIMAARYFILLYKYFPEGFGTSFNFLRWVGKYPQLFWIGGFTNLGLFGHIVIMWASDLRVQVEGLFYGAPYHDVAAIFAFFSLLVTTINFVTSVETRFYPMYRDYFSLFNDNGSIIDIDNVENNMKRVLFREMSYLEYKQVFVTIFFIVIGSILLPYSKLGINDLMLDIFRFLCIGYAFYAIANSIMLILLYFSDYTGALLSTAVFCVLANATAFFMRNNSMLYGVGFTIGSAAFCIVAYLRLVKYLRKIKYYVLSRQPVFAVENNGVLNRFSDFMDERADQKQKARREYYERKRENAAENADLPE